MKKQVILTIMEGSFEQGFPVNVEIREDVTPFSLIWGNVGRLPALGDIEILDSLKDWQSNFSRKNDGCTSRIKVQGEGTKVFNEQAAENLASNINQWLSSSEKSWRQILDGLQQHLQPNDEIRVILQTDDANLRRLPWPAWNFFSETYDYSEISLSTLTVKPPSFKKSDCRKSAVRILAVFGKNDGIDISFDRQVLDSLAERGAAITPLNKPNKSTLLECLRDEQGWHIFFFAGHSSTLPDGQIGEFEIGDAESISIDDLKNAMKIAIAQGLQLAIFNSCDGLGIANQLAKLYLPQSIVMREVVADEAAQNFLQNFLTAFANNQSLYASVREARRKLEDAKNKLFPGISWLPVICQNPAVEPLIWKQLLNWKCLHTLKGHADIVNSVAISPNQNIIASGSLDKTIKLWNLCTGELLHTFTGHSSGVIDVAFSPDGKTLASASNHEFFDGSIKLWDVANKQFKQSLGNTLLALRTSCLAFSPDEQTLANGHIGTTLMGGTIDIWNLKRSRIEKTLWGHVWEVNCLAFSKDGRILVSGGLDGAVKIWNWHRKELLHTLIRPVDFFGAVASWFDSSVGIIWCVAISPDGKTVAASGSQQPIQLWNTENGRLLRTFTEHSDSVYTLAFSPDGETLASGGADNTIRIWNFHTGELLETLEHLGPVQSVVFSYDGKTLVSGSADATVKIWRVPV
ncbi:CHAT domain-containing protein [Microcoleus sp. LEGE 07076]|uniref:WD40 domain-containing protein n=1 Tax=Microcoleus sp. LEGE 07076 TaxID=915322 RepID=UPI00187F654B|nr:CHAT domain-containing protein [Microcoleus sp. LEGE 07076]MBE9183309.1 CHAT domain-containing protein [Microcoleus sp. LEGE 07076]